jgi:hypothetical protein
MWGSQVDVERPVTGADGSLREGAGPLAASMPAMRSAHTGVGIPVHHICVEGCDLIPCVKREPVCGVGRGGGSHRTTTAPTRPFAHGTDLVLVEAVQNGLSFASHLRRFVGH